MNLIVKTKHTLSTEFVLAQVRGNNHWRTSQVRLEILNDRTLVYHAQLHSIIVEYQPESVVNEYSLRNSLTRSDI